jgi:hypothetical protein
MMATIALVHDLKTATKQSVMQVVANHLAGKSVRLMVLALCTAALAERVVFLSTMEAFATVVARADGHESLLSMAGEIRDLFATLGRVKRTSSIAS